MQTDTAAVVTSSGTNGSHISPKKKVMRVDHSFDAESDSEMSIAVGELISVLDEIDSGWYIGEVVGDEGRSGMFPATYCTVLESPPPLRKPKPPSPTREENIYAEVEDQSSNPALRRANTGRSAPARISGNSSPVAGVGRKKPPPPPVARGSKPVAGGLSGAGGDGRCRECGCDEFRANVFKKGRCNNCFHVHIPT